MCSCQNTMSEPMGGDRGKTLSTLGDITGILGGALSGAAGAVDSRRAPSQMSVAFGGPTDTILGLPKGVVIGGGVILGLGVVYALTR